MSNPYKTIFEEETLNDNYILEKYGENPSEFFERYRLNISKLSFWHRLSHFFSRNSYTEIYYFCHWIRDGYRAEYIVNYCNDYKQKYIIDRSYYSPLF